MYYYNHLQGVQQGHPAEIENCIVNDRIKWLTMYAPYMDMPTMRLRVHLKAGIVPGTTFAARRANWV